MKQFLLTMAGVFAGLVLFFIGVPFLILAMVAGAARPAPPSGPSVLTLDLRRGLTDQDSTSPFAALSGKSLSVMSVTAALRRAESDNAVKGLFVRLPEGGMPPAAADELRLAFKRFEATGKPVVAHSQGLYPSGVITSTYMLGAAANQLWMQPGAPFQAVGLASDDIFFKRFFDKYGVKAQYEQRYEYKNAVNSYLYDDYTPAHRQSELSWMGSVYGSALAQAAADRKESPAALRATLESGPYDAGDALAKGLIDRVGQVKEAQTAILGQAGDGAKLVEMDDYVAAAKAAGGGIGRPTVAVVNAEGVIMTGPSDTGFGGSQNVNSDDVSSALYQAAEDTAVKAIVFRVSSPGGSDTASEQILAAVRAAKAKKPVVVSMGTYGASGGYWISSAASAIVAEPTTLTGSIGVYGGKFALGEALSRFGVDMRQLSVGGGYAGAEGPAQPFTPTQRVAFSAAIDRVYEGFITRVASGRRLSPARVREIARGRVWTGVQAKQLGLVDQLGGFYQAVERAKGLAGLAGQEVRLKVVVVHKSPFEALQRAFGLDSSSLRALGAAASVLSDPRMASLTDEIGHAEARSRGALVLAPTPFH